MPLAPLRADSIRPPERGIRRRLIACSSANKQSSAGRKTAKHFPPQSTLQSVSNYADENRWASFALPTLRPERGAGRRLAACSSANKRGAVVSLFTIFQAARTRFPLRRPSVGAAQGDARHGCRARRDGTWMSLRAGPRSNLVGWVQPIELLRWASPILRSEAHRTTLSLLISGTDQQTTPNAPSGG